LKDNIIFEPWSNDLASYYKSADLFLLVSNYEGWGMAVVEAMAAGCPVLMTDVGCAGELARGGKNALVVPPGDKRALAEAIERLFSDRALAHDLSQNASAAVERLDSKQDYLDKYKNSWEAIIKS